MKKQYNIIDLFCGCGGLSKGFEEAGYKTLLGVDIEQAALNTFEKNHSRRRSTRSATASSRICLLSQPKYRGCSPLTAPQSSTERSK